MRLSPHFEAAEFRSRDGQPTPPGYLRELRVLCVCFLEPLRREFGPVTVHSGHRSRTHNEHVGGAERSRHLDLAGRAGAAADVSCKRGTVDQWYDFLDGLAIGGLGRYRTHVHADTRSVRARW
jgi:uncharacterized protein YcbK (DUF882 family)